MLQDPYLIPCFLNYRNPCHQIDFVVAAAVAAVAAVVAVVVAELVVELVVVGWIVLLAWKWQ